MDLYADDALTAQEMIKEFADGLTCTVKREGGLTYVGIPCVITDFGFTDHAGRLIEEQDKRVYIAALDIPIVPNPEYDTISFSKGDVIKANEYFKIVGNRPTAPGNEAIMHDLQVRSSLFKVPEPEPEPEP